MANTRNTDPLSWNNPIVDSKGFPTPEFIRQWQAQKSLNGGLGDLLAIEFIAGIGLTGGGVLGALSDITFNLANTAVTPNTYGDATHIPRIVIDAQGRITSATVVDAAGGGSGSAVLPLVTGDVPGPVAISDDVGQYIGVPLA